MFLGKVPCGLYLLHRSRCLLLWVSHGQYTGERLVGALQVLLNWNVVLDPHKDHRNGDYK